MIWKVSAPALLLVSLVLPVVRAIYPDDHWSYSTKLMDTGDFEKLVQPEIDDGKTGKETITRHL
jgi:hypothetical protein